MVDVDDHACVCPLLPPNHPARADNQIQPSRLHPAMHGSSATGPLPRICASPPARWTRLACRPSNLKPARVGPRPSLKSLGATRRSRFHGFAYLWVMRSCDYCRSDCDRNAVARRPGFASGRSQ
jgi:hypothetical protein